MLHAIVLAFLAGAWAGTEGIDATPAERLAVAVGQVTGGAAFGVDARTAETAALDQVAGDYAGLQLFIAQKQFEAEAALAEARRRDASPGGLAAAEAQYRADLSAALATYQRAAHLAHAEWASRPGTAWSPGSASAHLAFAAGEAAILRAAQQVGLPAPRTGGPRHASDAGNRGSGCAHGSRANAEQAVQVAGECGERLTLIYSDGGLVQVIRRGADLSVHTVATGSYSKPVTKRVVFADGLIADVTRYGAGASAQVLAAGCSPASAGYDYADFDDGGCSCYGTGYAWTGAATHYASGGSPAPTPTAPTRVVDDLGERAYVEGPDGSSTELTLRAGRLDVRQIRPPTRAMSWEAFVLFSDGTRVQVLGADGRVTARKLGSAPTSPAQRLAVGGETGARPSPPIPASDLGEPPPPSFLEDPNGALAVIARFEQQVSGHRLAYLNDLVAALGRADADILAAVSLSPAQRAPALAGAVEALRQAGVARHDVYRSAVEQETGDLEAQVALAQARP